MEYGLWLAIGGQYVQEDYVLILVLMEYGLWLRVKEVLWRLIMSVLILVLMEYGLWLIN